VTLGLGVLGFFVGMGVAAALLHYDGQRPVNVSWYLFVLVLLQLLLLGGTAACGTRAARGRCRARCRTSRSSGIC
jgi:hypothetical protein